MMSRAINRIKDDYVKGIATIKTIEQYMADGDVVDLSKIDLSKLTDLEQYALSIAVKKMKEAIEKKKPIMFIQYEPIVGIINEIKNSIEKHQGKFKHQIVYCRLGDKYTIAYGDVEPTITVHYEEVTEPKVAGVSSITTTKRKVVKEYIKLTVYTLTKLEKGKLKLSKTGGYYLVSELIATT